jgi:hypothetical protein
VSDRQRTFPVKPTGDGRLDSLAAQAAMERVVLEVLLVAAVCSKPSEGVAAVEAAGAPDLIAQPDLRAIYDAVSLVLHSNVRPLDRAVTLARMLLSDDGYWKAAPYTGHWGDCIAAASWWPDSLVSLWTAEWEFPELDAADLAGRLVDFARRQDLARDHYRHACRLLAGATSADATIEPTIYDIDNPVRIHGAIARVSREMAVPFDVVWGEVVAAGVLRESRPGVVEVVPVEDQPDIEDLPASSSSSPSWLDEITSLEIGGEAA